VIADVIERGGPPGGGLLGELGWQVIDEPTSPVMESQERAVVRVVAISADEDVAVPV
jgi:hypothetical protein